MKPILQTAFLIASLAALLHAQDSKPTSRRTPASAPTSDAGVHGFEIKRMDGTTTKLGDWKGKVLLIVNTASQCGLTPQYAGLEKLHEQFAAKGFSVLAFPANDFGKQEPGTNEEIAKFCKDQYSVTFPVFAKIAVKGKETSPLYHYLTKDGPFPGDVKWNFQKYLIDRTGKVIARFEPQVKPDDPKVTAAIEAELAKPALEKKAKKEPKGDGPGKSKNVRV